MKNIPPAATALLACALAVAGCATNSPPAQANYNLPPMRADTIARLAVDGPNAFINRRPASNGSYVFDGDIVTTGAGTSAMLVLNDGGSVQLDQNTDPEFRLLRQGACLLMSILRGQAAIDTKGRCIEFRNERLNTAGVAHSLVNLRVSEQEAWVTVVEGSVDMMAPRAARLGPYDQYSTASQAPYGVQRMTAADAAATLAWRQRYFGAAQPRADGLSTPEKLGIAAGAAALLYGIFGRDHKATPQPDATAGSGTSQGADSGWCCPPTGGSAIPSNPTACRRLQGSYYPAGARPNVCRPYAQ